MPVDHARRQVLARCVDDLGIGTDIVGDIADGDDALTIDGNIGLIDLFRDDIDQATAPGSRALLCRRCPTRRE